jgi:MFS family permease
MSVAASSMKDDLGWTEIQKGNVLSSFYWGYTAGQIPASYLMMNGTLSPKWTFGLAVFIPSVLTILVPFFARSSFHMALFIRMLIGFVESATFPCCYQFYTIWIPLRSKTFIIAVLLSGTYLGEILGFSLSGALIASSIKVGGSDVGGWPAVFYVFGLLGVVWFPFWAYFVYETPEQHPGISVEELEFIRGGKSEAVSAEAHRGSTSSASAAAAARQAPDGRLRLHSADIPDPRNLGEDIEGIIQRTFSRDHAEREADSSTEHLRSVDLDTEQAGHDLKVRLLSEQHSPLSAHDSERSNLLGGTKMGPLHVLRRDGSYGVVDDTSALNDSDTKSPLLGDDQRSAGAPKGKDEDVEFSRIPWRIILHNPGFWNLMFSAWTIGFLNFSLLSELPSYLEGELGFSASTAGVLSTLPFALMFITATGMGQLLFSMQKYRGWSTKRVRRIAQTVGLVGPASCMLVCGYGGLGQWGSYCFILLATGCLGSSSAGYSCAYLEFSPKFSPFLNTIGNAVGSIGGILGPQIISALLTADQSTGWRDMFLLCAVMCYASVVVWFMFAVNEPVPECNTMLPLVPVASSDRGNVTAGVQPSTPRSDVHSKI